MRFKASSLYLFQNFSSPSIVHEVDVNMLRVDMFLCIFLRHSKLVAKQLISATQFNREKH
jgi:hypothetical protein